MKRNLKQIAAGLLAAAMLAALLPVSAFAEEAAPAGAEQPAVTEPAAPAEEAPEPAAEPTEEPTEEPAEEPTEEPAEELTPAPTAEPTAAPAPAEPTAEPTTEPTAKPAGELAGTPAPVEGGAGTMPLEEKAAEKAVPYIFFDARDGSVEAVEAGKITELPATDALTAYGYAFAGWYQEPDGAGGELTLEDVKTFAAGSEGCYVYAKWVLGGKTVRTTALDCTKQETAANAAQGWAWDAESNVLTLDGADFYVAGDYYDEEETDPKSAITLPDGAALAVKPGTRNSVKAEGIAVQGWGPLVLQGAGSLSVWGGIGAGNQAGILVSGQAEGLNDGALTVDRLSLEAEGDDTAVFSFGDITIKNGAVVVAYGDKDGVLATGNISVTESRLAGGKRKENVRDSLGVCAKGAITLKNGEIDGYGEGCGIGAEAGIFAEQGFISDAAPDTPAGFVSGKTKMLKQTDPEKPAVLRQESRTLYYYPQYGKMYDGLKSEGAGEVTAVSGWEAEKNAGGTFDLLLEDFAYATTAGTALVITADKAAAGNCTIKLRGENSLSALAQGAGVKDCIALEADYDLTILNEDDPGAKLLLAAWEADGSGATEAEQFVGSNGLNAAGRLTAENVALDVLSGDVIGPKIEGAESESVGIVCGGDMMMTNVALTIAAGDVTDNGDNGMGCVSRGIETLGSMTLTNCQTEIKPGKAGRSEGIYCYEASRNDRSREPETLTVNGGKLDVSTDSAALHAVGLAFYNIKVLNGADVQAVVGKARDLSHGVFTRDLTVDSASLCAVGCMGGIRLGNSCTLKNVAAKGNAAIEDECSLPAEWIKAGEESRGSLFTLVGSGEVCIQVLIDAATPAPIPTAAPAPAETAAPRFTVNAWVTAGGTVSPAGVTSYKQGETAAYTMAPAAGCRIVKVVVDGVDVGAVSSYTFPALNRSHEIGVYFEETAAAVKRGAIPQTGDETPLALYAALMAAAAAGLAGCALARRRKKTR